MTQDKNRLSKLTLHSYRGIEGLSLQNLSRINLLVGSNNSGKTSILEAISLLMNSLDPVAWISLACANRKNIKPEKQIRLLNNLFPINNPNTVDIIIEGMGVQNVRFEANAKVLEGQDANQIEVHVDTQTHDEVGKRLKDAMDFIIHGKKQVRLPKPKFPVNFPFYLFDARDVDVNSLPPVLLKQVANEDKKRDILDLLTKIDESITDIHIYREEDKSLALYLQKGEEVIPMDCLGFGFNRILQLGLITMGLKNGILLIDSIETAVHYSLLSTVYLWLIRTCRKLNIQLFSTLYNLESLDAFVEIIPETAEDDLMMYQISKSGEKTNVSSFDFSELKAIRTGFGSDVR